jgi:hypothetical protein
MMMNNPRWLLFPSLALAMLNSGIAQGQNLPISQIIDVRMRASDARLDTAVTLDTDRMCLGEVLEKVSAQTGVSISIPAEDLSSGVPITCHVQKIPLVNFMNSIWSLVGFSKATWQITSDAQHNTRSYQLLPTALARALAERLNREADRYSADLVALLLKMHAMTPKERQANVHRLAQAMLSANDAAAKNYVDDPTTTEHFWAMIGVFATILTPEQQVQVLKGGTISLPLNNLNADTQTLLHASTGHSYTERNGVRIEEEPADTVRFSYSQYSPGNKYRDGNKQHMIKNLSIGVGNAHSFVSGTYLGGLELGVKALAYAGWILPGDLRHGETENQIVSSLPELPEDTLWRHAPAFDLLLTQLAEAQKVSYIAVVPDEANNQITLSVGKSAQQCLEDLRSQANLMHKWRDGVLLCNYPVWFYGDDAQYPYAVVKRLRESKRRNAGRPLTLPNIADDVITLTAVQMTRLAKEFPQIDDNRIKRPIFVFYKKYPGILSEEGMAVDLNMVAMLKEWKLMPRLAEKDTLKKMRIIEKALPHARDDRRFYRIQFQTTQQKEWRQTEDVSILP